MRLRRSVPIEVPLIPATRSSKESANLDLLRAMAVLGVLGVHLCLFLGVLPAKIPFQRIGRFSVLLFFVHTSFVLMYSLERQNAGRGWRNLFSHFMLRRGFRLYPLSIVVLLVVYLLKIPAADFGAGTMLRTHAGMPGLIANLLLVQNITYSPNIIAQLWSLPLEIQMYLLLPALFLFARRTRSLRPLLLLWVAAVVIASVVPMISGRLTIAQYVPTFIPGVIAYRLSANKTPHVWPAFLWPVALIALALIFVVTQPLDQGWVLCLTTGLIVSRFKEITLPWLRRAAHVVAKYSYGIYLTHMIAVWIGFLYLASLPVAGRWAVFLATLVTIPLLLYHLVEAPLTRYGAGLAQRWYPARHLPPPQLPELDETTPLSRAQLHVLQLPATATK